MHNKEIIKRNAERVYHDLLELYLEFDIPDIPDARLLRVVKKSDVKGMLVDIRVALDHIDESMYEILTRNGQLELMIGQLPDASNALRRVERKLSTWVEKNSMVIRNTSGNQRNVSTQMLNNRNRLRETISLSENFIEEFTRQT